MTVKPVHEQILIPVRRLLSLTSPREISPPQKQESARSESSNVPAIAPQVGRRGSRADPVADKDILATHLEEPGCKLQLWEGLERERAALRRAVGLAQ